MIIILQWKGLSMGRLRSRSWNWNLSPRSKTPKSVFWISLVKGSYLTRTIFLISVHSYGILSVLNNNLKNQGADSVIGTGAAAVFTELAALCFLCCPSGVLAKARCPWTSGGYHRDAMVPEPAVRPQPANLSQLWSRRGKVMPTAPVFNFNKCHR